MGSAGVALMLAFVLGVPLVFSDILVRVEWCGSTNDRGFWTGGYWAYPYGCKVNLTNTGFEKISVVGCSLDGNLSVNILTDGPKTSSYGLPDLQYNNPEDVGCYIWSDTPYHQVNGSIAHGQISLSDGRTIDFEGVWR